MLQCLVPLGSLLRRPIKANTRNEAVERLGSRSHFLPVSYASFSAC